MDVKPKNRTPVLTESVPINTQSLPSYSTMLPYSSPATPFSSSLLLKVPMTRPGKGEFALSSTWLDAMKASSPTATCTNKNQSNKNLSSSVIDLAYKSWMVESFFPKHLHCFQVMTQLFVDTSTLFLQLRYPSALDFFDQITSSAKGKRIALFLDYDGTLSPIVEDPDSAFMSSTMRAAVKNVAKRFPTAIISGRSREKVYEFVQLSELHYAGSHGMDIAAPTKRPVWDTQFKSTDFSNQQGGDLTVFHPASEFLPMIEEVYHSLIEATKHIKGAIVENNKFCVSLHYRNVDENSWLSIGQIADRILRHYTQLRLTHGRKVLEVRPMINWDKGKAVEFLLESLGLGGCEDVLPIYVGDDRTDEDAFKVLKERQQGFGVLVSSIPKESDASYSLKDPSEVMCFLDSLAKWRA